MPPCFFSSFSTRLGSLGIPNGESIGLNLVTSARSLTSGHPLIGCISIRALMETKIYCAELN